MGFIGIKGFAPTYFESKIFRFHEEYLKNLVLVVNSDKKY